MPFVNGQSLWLWACTAVAEMTTTIIYTTVKTKIIAHCHVVKINHQAYMPSNA